MTDLLAIGVDRLVRMKMKLTFHTQRLSFVMFLGTLTTRNQSMQLKIKLTMILMYVFDSIYLFPSTLFSKWHVRTALFSINSI